MSDVGPARQIMSERRPVHMGFISAAVGAGAPSHSLTRAASAPGLTSPREVEARTSQRSAVGVRQQQRRLGCRRVPREYKGCGQSRRRAGCVLL